MPRDGTSVANYTQVKYMNYLQLDKYTVLKYTPLRSTTTLIPGLGGHSRSFEMMPVTGNDAI